MRGVVNVASRGRSVRFRTARRRVRRRLPRASIRTAGTARRRSHRARQARVFQFVKGFFILVVFLCALRFRLFGCLCLSPRPYFTTEKRSLRALFGDYFFAVGRQSSSLAFAQHDMRAASGVPPESGQSRGAAALLPSFQCRMRRPVYSGAALRTRRGFYARPGSAALILQGRPAPRSSSSSASIHRARRLRFRRSLPFTGADTSSTGTPLASGAPFAPLLRRDCLRPFHAPPSSRSRHTRLHPLRYPLHDSPSGRISIDESRTVVRASDGLPNQTPTNKRPTPILDSADILAALAAGRGGYRQLHIGTGIFGALIFPPGRRRNAPGGQTPRAPTARRPFPAWHNAPSASLSAGASSAPIIGQVRNLGKRAVFPLGAARPRTSRGCRVRIRGRSVAFVNGILSKNSRKSPPLSMRQSRNRHCLAVSQVKKHLRLVAPAATFGIFAKPRVSPRL